MIKVVCAMLIIVIKDLKVRLSNLNLPTGKSIICFKLLAEIKETDKQISDALYYKY